MKKNFKSIKATMIMGLLLVSVFIAITPNSSAGIIVNFSSTVLLTWDSTNTSEPIVPISGLRNYDINLEFTITGSPFGRFLIYPLLYEDRRIDIKLDLKDYPDWATVTLPIQTIPANIPSIGESKSYRSTLQISLKEDAPAFETGVIAIQVNVPSMGHIIGFDQVLELSFKPGYRALIDVSPQISSKIIGPMNSAVFAIDITNQGNAVTKCFLDNVRTEPGWIAVVDNNVIIDAGEGQKETVYLTVYPPRGFGYHDDKTSISIDITPTWAENTAIQGNTERLSLIVESRGISFIGIEVVLPIIILIALVIIIFYLIFVKKMFIKR